MNKNARQPDTPSDELDKFRDLTKKLIALPKKELREQKAAYNAKRKKRKPQSGRKHSPRSKTN